MKRILCAVLAALLTIYSLFAQTPSGPSFEKWSSDKYSMFIHFGLYSHLGGVWEGEPVRQGYSEQIQSFAGIFSDWYAETAYEFNPVNFDADEIALLAKQAGMRSVVFTSKHHDGFCMFDTKTTRYNSVAMTSSGRDYVRELSQACERHGLNFGLYFSLIDWNFPHAYPISSHNADFITPEHHEFSKAQVRELLTGYGPVSELWFDMGSLQPSQSRELYDLVKSLQPSCMVSGRLGNDVYDFAVMADNKLPQTALHAPWQSAASMFPETWSYRSWQDRGVVSVKVAEKLRSLIDVVSAGGNYLLNIGPAADGSVVPFEKDVLLGIGKWLNKHGHAIYDTDASPFPEKFSWGNVTMKGNVLYLLLTGECPEDGVIRLPLKGGRLKGVKGSEATLKAGECIVTAAPYMYSPQHDVHVITLTFDRPVSSMVTMNMVKQGEKLSWSNAIPEYSYSCFDYYSNYRSTVAYRWNVNVYQSVDEIELAYTKEEAGREIVLEVDGVQIPVVLSENFPRELSVDSSMSDYRFERIRGGVFDGPASWDWYTPSSFTRSEALVSKNVHPFCNYVMSAHLDVKTPGYHVLDVTSGNGVEVVVNGKTMLKHLNAYGTKERVEKVLLDLPAGQASIIVRFYNRFEDSLVGGVRLAGFQEMYTKKVKLPSRLNPGARTIKVYADDKPSPHSDCGLHNLIIRL